MGCKCCFCCLGITLILLLLWILTGLFLWILMTDEAVEKFHQASSFTVADRKRVHRPTVQIGEIQDGTTLKDRTTTQRFDRKPLSWKWSMGLMLPLFAFGLIPGVASYGFQGFEAFGVGPPTTTPGRRLAMDGTEHLLMDHGLAERGSHSYLYLTMFVVFAVVFCGLLWFYEQCCQNGQREHRPLFLPREAEIRRDDPEDL